MSQCKFCGQVITWLKEGRKNVPVDSDGGTHSCPEMKKSISSIKKMDRTSISTEEIAKYEQAINQKKK